MLISTPRKAHQLLLDHLGLLQGLDHSLPVLDLACGTGQNGLMLARQGIPVVFADKSAAALTTVQRCLQQDALPGRSWHIDLEPATGNPLAAQQFSAIIVFRYLHRPLLTAIKQALQPGGVVIYETFTTANRRFGRPHNPDFLLQPGELETAFRDWQTIFRFEGVLSEPERAVAQLVSRKPAEQ